MERIIVVSRDEGLLRVNEEQDVRDEGGNEAQQKARAAADEQRWDGHARENRSHTAAANRGFWNATGSLLNAWGMMAM